MSFKIVLTDVDPQAVETSLLPDLDELSGEDRRQAEIGARIAQQAVNSDVLGHHGEGYRVDVKISGSAKLADDPAWDAEPGKRWAEKTGTTLGPAPKIHTSGRLVVEISHGGA